MREGGDPVVAVCDDRDNVHTKLLENQRPRTAQEHGGELPSKQTQPFIHLRGTIGKLERLRGPEGEREEGKTMLNVTKRGRRLLVQVDNLKR